MHWAACLHGLAEGAQLSASVAIIILLTRRKPMRTTLDSGAWIEHVPIQDIKGKHIRDYARAGKGRIDEAAVDDEGQVDVRALVTGMDLGEAAQEKHDALWAIVISAWSYEFPVPVFDRGSGETTGAGVLEELPGDDYQDIDLLLQPFQKKLTARPSPKGATTSASNGSSKAAARNSRQG